MRGRRGHLLCLVRQFVLHGRDPIEAEPQEAAEELDHEREVLLPAREERRPLFGVVELRRELRTLRTQLSHRLARRRLAHEVREEEAQEEVALERDEGGRGARVRTERLEALLGERLDGPLASLAGLRAGGEVAEPRETLWLDVVLALSRPVEHASEYRFLFARA